MFPSKANALFGKDTTWGPIPQPTKTSNLSPIISPQWDVLEGKRGYTDTPGIEVMRAYLRDESYNLSSEHITMGEGDWAYTAYPIGYAMPNGQLATREDARLYPRGRLVIFTPETILKDVPNPHWHGLFPVVRFTLDQLPWTLLGASVVGDLIPMQDSLNEALRGSDDGQRIYAKQHYDGGWSWWDGEESDPHTSAYVVYGLVEAREADYPVSQVVLESAIGYLKKNIPELHRNDPTWEFNRTAFMLYVLARGKELQVAQTNFIYEYRTSLSLYGKAYLAQALYFLDPEDERINSLLSDLESEAVLSAAGAHWEEGYRDYWNWKTDTRTTAIVLNAFVQINPQSPVTAQAVRWLMAHREKASAASPPRSCSSPSS